MVTQTKVQAATVTGIDKASNSKKQAMVVLRHDENGIHFLEAKPKYPEHENQEFWQQTIQGYDVIAVDTDPKKLLKSLSGSNDRDSHLTDALMAALTGLIYLRSGGAGLASSSVRQWHIRRPESEEEEKLALQEGWIFFPKIREKGRVL